MKQPAKGKLPAAVAETQSWKLSPGVLRHVPIQCPKVFPTQKSPDTFSPPVLVTGGPEFTIPGTSRRLDKFAFRFWAKSPLATGG